MFILHVSIATCRRICIGFKSVRFNLIQFFGASGIALSCCGIFLDIGLDIFNAQFVLLSPKNLSFTVDFFAQLKYKKISHEMVFFFYEEKNELAPVASSSEIRNLHEPVCKKSRSQSSTYAT